MRIQCGVPGIAASAMWEAQAPKKLPRSTKPLTQRKATWKGTTLQIIGCERTPGRDFLGDQLLANGDNNAPDHRRIPVSVLQTTPLLLRWISPGIPGGPSAGMPRRDAPSCDFRLNSMGISGPAGRQFCTQTLLLAEVQLPISGRRTGSRAIWQAICLWRSRPVQRGQGTGKWIGGRVGIFDFVKD
jgi:hypothetical protein